MDSEIAPKNSERLFFTVIFPSNREGYERKFKPFSLLFGLGFFPFIDGLGEDVFDLRIDRPKIVLRPRGDFLIQRWGKSQKNGLLFHQYIVPLLTMG